MTTKYFSVNWMATRSILTVFIVTVLCKEVTVQRRDSNSFGNNRDSNSFGNNRDSNSFGNNHHSSPMNNSNSSPMSNSNSSPMSNSNSSPVSSGFINRPSRGAPKKSYQSAHLEKGDLELGNEGIDTKSLGYKRMYMGESPIWKERSNFIKIFQELELALKRIGSDGNGSIEEGDGSREEGDGSENGNGSERTGGVANSLVNNSQDQLNNRVAKLSALINFTDDLVLNYLYPKFFRMRILILNYHRKEFEFYFEELPETVRDRKRAQFERELSLEIKKCLEINRLLMKHVAVLNREYEGKKRELEEKYDFHRGQHRDWMRRISANQNYISRGIVDWVLVPRGSNGEGAADKKGSANRESGAVNRESGAVNRESGAVNRESGAVNREGPADNPEGQRNNPERQRIRPAHARRHTTPVEFNRPPATTVEFNRPAFNDLNRTASFHSRSSHRPHEAFTRPYPHDHLSRPHDHLSRPHDHLSRPHDHLSRPHDHHSVPYHHEPRSVPYHEPHSWPYRGFIRPYASPFNRATALNNPSRMTVLNYPTPPVRRQSLRMEREFRSPFTQRPQIVVSQIATQIPAVTTPQIPAVTVPPISTQRPPQAQIIPHIVRSKLRQSSTVFSEPVTKGIPLKSTPYVISSNHENAHENVPSSGNVITSSENVISSDNNQSSSSPSNDDSIPTAHSAPNPGTQRGESIHDSLEASEEPRQGMEASEEPRQGMTSEPEMTNEPQSAAGAMFTARPSLENDPSATGPSLENEPLSATSPLPEDNDNTLLPDNGNESSPSPSLSGSDNTLFPEDESLECSSLDGEEFEALSDFIF